MNRHLEEGVMWAYVSVYMKSAYLIRGSRWWDAGKLCPLGWGWPYEETERKYLDFNIAL